ncbi:DUF2628 domain-containing protein [Roseomonas sp. OT10]|uniref:DUF2628 domain-containing protein n=1 Tax=Roseomonas cutis TaxID=2897332 RepID=UPI001E2C1701|nr:DUF2628 domain-containing protein [Roseomonas sp. OT10]UFN48948.1 DUF2628 domain-containing protein [Roseomonas sp. OT10]
MRVFTVHAPGAPALPAPLAASIAGSPWATVPDASGPAPRLVPEGFAWWGFLFPPLWLAAKRLWWGLLGWLALAGLVALLPEPVEPWAALALALLVGFHGRDLQRWTLARRGWPERDVVVARDEEAALLRLAERAA